jgi:hypothetical protein
MKKLIKTIFFILPAGLLFTACEGPMGRQGADANQSCTECHNNSAAIETKQAQWEESVHAKGENAAYANRTGCVQCHTSQGFLEAVAEGSTQDISVPSDPMQINCYTCHKIHETYTADDYELTKPGAEVLLVKYKGTSVTWDKGNSNQCVACHQAREITPMPVENGATFAITNTRMGAHHGPNSNLILGKLPMELTGAAYPETNPHSTSEGCIDCHMAQPYGYQAGGHNMGMTYDSHGTETLLTNGCLKCHPGENATTMTAKYNSLKTQIEGKLDNLESQLVAAGIYNPSTGLAKTGSFNPNAALAYLTFNTIVEDRSSGVHNPAYTKTLLDNAIASMTQLGYSIPAK